jgi:hypothetical protein
MKQKISVKNREQLSSTVEEICAIHFNMFLKKKRERYKGRKEGIKARDRKKKMTIYSYLQQRELSYTVIRFLSMEITVF